MKKSKIIVGIAATFLVTVVSIICFSNISYADSETKLTTSVPINSKLKIIIDGNGSIKIDDKEFTKNVCIDVEHGRNICVLILPEKNNHIKEVLFDEQKIICDDGKIEVCVNQAMSTLKVSFSEDSKEDVATNDVNDLTLWLLFIVIASLVMLFVIWLLRKKEN